MGTQQWNKVWIELINKILIDFDLFFDLLPIFLLNIQLKKGQIFSQQGPDNPLWRITQGLFIIASFQHHNQFLLDL
jgi:hypothetical protein